MIFLASDTSADKALQTTTNVFERFTHNYLNTHSIVVLIVSILVALLLGRFVAFVLRRLVLVIGGRADKAQTLQTANRLRHYETLVVLSIALIRALLFLFAIYFWWMYVHPTGQASGIIGASALVVVVLSGALSPALRDIAAGSVMMAEHWYGVGDHVKIDPFVDMQGVVERVTLRSTRLRGLNGEIIWINNQNIQAVRLAPKGVRTIGLEMFVTDLAAGEKLIERTNRRLPIGPLLVVSPLEITSTEQVGDELWHITAIGDTAPGREWLIENSAVELIKWMDEQNKIQVLAHGPLPRYADAEADRRFKRTITNARKRPAPKRRAGKKATSKTTSNKNS